MPAVVEAVNGQIPVLMDGGIRRVVDVAKAIAMGAACCLIVRPQLWGRAIAGEQAVSHVLEIFAREIARSMALLGAARVSDLTPELVRSNVR